MQDWVICKACGYTLPRARLKDQCPACGVPANRFEPFTHPLAPWRRALLTLDLHPVCAHFPQAFAASLPVLCLLAWGLRDPTWRSHVLSAIIVLCVAQPIVVVLTFVAGLADGKVRFRRVTTPLLIKKQLVGGLLFLIACALCATALTRLPADPALLRTVFGLSLAALGCASALGILGTRLLNAKFPG